MNHADNVDRWVIPCYRHRRTFYEANGYFQQARDQFYRLVEQERPESILDVGCGHGWDSKPLGVLCRYVGIDPIEANLVLARKDNPDGHFRIGFMQDTGFADGAFDWVYVSTVWDILPSVEDMRQGIEECLRVARRAVFSLDCNRTPKHMAERYMMIPMHYGLTIRRVGYNPEKEKADYLWRIDKEGILDEGG